MVALYTRLKSFDNTLGFFNILFRAEKTDFHTHDLPISVMCRLHLNEAVNVSNVKNVHLAPRIKWQLE